MLAPAGQLPPLNTIWVPGGPMRGSMVAKGPCGVGEAVAPDGRAVEAGAFEEPPQAVASKKQQATSDMALKKVAWGFTTIRRHA